MVKFCLMVSSFSSACALHWCDSGLNHNNVAMTGAPVDVIYGQAALSSTNPQINQSLGNMGLFHTATVFKQGDKYWTLEFDLTSADTNPFSGFFPSSMEGGNISWSNDAKWCLTEGLLHGRDHWLQAFDKIATMSPTQFHNLFRKMVNPMNATAVKYNIFRVANMSHPIDDPSRVDDLINDVTCGNGVIWTRDHLIAHGVEVQEPRVGWKVTRVTLKPMSISPVDMTDVKEKQKVMSFYENLQKIAGDALMDKMAAFQTFLHFEFAYSPQTDTYYRLNNQPYAPPIPGYFVAPNPWPLIDAPSGYVV